MLNLAILVLVVLVGSTLWFLLRPPAPIAAEQGVSDDAPPADGDDPAEPPGHPAVRVVVPPQSDERAPNH